MQKITRTIGINYRNSLVNTPLSDTITIDYEKAGFRVKSLRTSVKIPEGKLSSDRALINNIGVPINSDYAHQMNFRDTDTKLSIRVDLEASTETRNLSFLMSDMDTVALEEGSYVEKLLDIGDYGYIYCFINYHDKPVYITHCSSISLDSSRRRAKVTYYSEEEELNEVIGKIVYPGEKLNIPYDRSYARDISTLIVYKKVDVTVKRIKFTKRTVYKNAFKEILTQRKVSKRYSTRHHLPTLRTVVNTAITRVKHTRRRIKKSIIKDYDTYRRTIASKPVRIFYDVSRFIVSSQKKKLRTNRKVALDTKNVNLWLDTKLVISNSIRSRGPLLRKTAINTSNTVPNIFRPVVWVYKLNDGHPIDLDTIRTVHKSTEPKINTLRRINYHFTYDTTAHVSRIISNTSLTSIKSIRKNICSVHNGHKSIRRVSKDNCICCNALTSRITTNIASTAADTTRTVIKKQYSSTALDTQRLTAINYQSGYAFTKRQTYCNSDHQIDLYRPVTINHSNKIDIQRNTTAFDWFYNHLTRTVTNQPNISYMTSRQTSSNKSITGDISRSLYRKIEPILTTKREVNKRIEADIDTNRKIAGEISKDIDITKKIARKYIYVNKGQRLIVKSIEPDIDAYRKINKLLITDIDTVRDVESDNVEDTLCIDFKLKHGILYEIDRCFYKTNK